MKNSDKKILSISYAILFLIGGIFLFLKILHIGLADEIRSANQAFKTYQQADVWINDHSYHAYMAFTDTQQRQGLSGITSMFPEEGMLFQFSKPQILNFWMKDMNFNLDFVWIRDGQVVDLIENVSSNPIDQLKILSPKVSADSVLELNAGQITKAHLKIGQELLVK